MFAWPAGPVETARWQVDFDLDTLSVCGGPSSLTRFTDDAAPYLQLSAGDWSSLAVGAWSVRATALDWVDTPLLERDSTVVLCELAELAAGGSAVPPVLLLHDWGSPRRSGPIPAMMWRRCWVGPASMSGAWMDRLSVT